MSCILYTDKSLVIFNVFSCQSFSKLLYHLYKTFGCKSPSLTKLRKFRVYEQNITIGIKKTATRFLHFEFVPNALTFHTNKQTNEQSVIRFFLTVSEKKPFIEYLKM